ncbi:hypothetical protein [Cetobacterium sp.]|uniref:hypothetical protein n=1 Tax=Cetobacterium sp. TaxID=2071632 RepID=UPI003F3F5ED8
MKYNGWTNRATWNWSNHLMCTDDRILFFRALNDDLGGMSDKRFMNICQQVVGSDEVDGDLITDVNIQELKEALKDI